MSEPISTAIVDLPEELGQEGREADNGGLLSVELAVDWDVDPHNARNWSGRRKLATTLLVSLIGFVCALESAILAPSRDQLQQDYSLSTIVSVLPISLYNLGMASGPTIASPLSETFGRKAVYLIVLPLFVVFVLATGFSNSIVAIVVCRFFAGVFASPSVAIAAATIADMYVPGERAMPLILYYTTPTLAALIGPLIGGFVVEAKGWRWTQWTTLFFAAVVFPPILLVRESYKKTVLERRAKHQNRQQNSTGIRGTSLQETLRATRLFMTSSLGRPVHMLLTEPIVGLMCLYMSFQFGLLYCNIIAIPYVFSTVYGFGLGAQGLAFLGPIIGCMLGSVLLTATHKWIYQPRLDRYSAEQEHEAADFPPEERLYGAMIGSVFLPAGLLWYAWTARADIHWICPVVAQGLAQAGSMMVYVPSGLYMMDTYGARYGASASGANSLLRYLLATTFPLFTTQMYAGIGVGWASTVLACCTLAMAPIPWAFYRWGPGLRTKSSYQRGD